MSPLVGRAAAQTSGITVTFTGTALSHPQIVEVEVSNVGNKDFEPAHFLGTPIEIVLTGGTVVSVLRETSVPTVRRVLHATQHPDHVALDTSTPLHKGQTLQYVILVDAGEQQSVVPNEPEIDVRVSATNCKVERRNPPTLQPSRGGDSVLASVIAGAATIITAFVALLGGALFK
ncbi:hypothetical protein [Streptomyces sp. CA-106110]|uniref:hypothetical protein n=1 Tax=Streptomyces sp. CA-106110 TaxID=3240044 RepID=UPI003D9353E6